MDLLSRGRLFFWIGSILFVSPSVLAAENFPRALGDDAEGNIAKAVVSVKGSPVTDITQSKGGGDNTSTDEAGERLGGILDEISMQTGVVVTDLNFERFNNRIYSANRWKPWDIPSPLKCSEFDKRSIHFCLEPRFFEPSARVFFDTGSDDPNEIDVFNDGALNVNIDLISLYLPWRIGKSENYDSWSWGPLVGVGISSPPQDSSNGESEAPSAPVVMFSYGVLLEYKIGQGESSFGFEIGRATGFSSDESLDDNRDSGVYVGIRFDIKRPN